MESLRQDLILTDGNLELEGQLTLPAGARGLVIFAHGSGSSRFSPRNQSVAGRLNEAGLGTFLFDLLSAEESQDRRFVFDVPLLAKRLLLAVRTLREKAELRNLPFGFFGASTGAAAALWAATEFGSDISAIVCRGGRPDLAAARLKEVSAPTLLLVGSRDEAVITMNRRAFSELRNAKLSIIPGASHLFEETGTLELVEKEACEWFLEQFWPRNHRRSA